MYRREVAFETLQELYTLSGDAVGVLREILQGDFPTNYKIKCAEIVLDRICGKSVGMDEVDEQDITPANVKDIMRLNHQLAQRERG